MSERSPKPAAPHPAARPPSDGRSASPFSPTTVTEPAPEISFIVPLYNCLALTQAMLASLEATLPRRVTYEIILVDDGSTDGTRDWLATLKSPRVRVIFNEQNRGYAFSNNRAATMARGQRLVLLNNDLVLLPGWLEPMLAAHRRLGSRAGLVGNVQLDARTGAIDHTGILFDLKAKPEHDRRALSRLARVFARVRPVPAVTAACAILSKSLWHALGGFDEGYVNGGEDVDLCFRARAYGKVNAVALRSIVRHHVSSTMGRKLRDEANSERLARRWGAEFARCAARDWCRDYVATMRTEPGNYDPAFASRVWMHAAGLTRTPPREAIAALEAALQLEFVRWEKLLRS